METTRIKIRGIYATALTQLFLGKGFSIVEPSVTIRERFGIEPAYQHEGVLVYDKQEKSGVLVEGGVAEVGLVIQALREALPNAIIRATSPEPQKTLGESRGTRISWSEFLKEFGGSRSTYDVEFPYDCKLALDTIRSKRIPTLPWHHLLKAIDSQRVDEVEKELPYSPEKREEIAINLKKRLIYDQYRVGEIITIEHVKPDGKTFYLRGRIDRFDVEDASLELWRRFRGRGSYDGLDIPQAEGDYGVVWAEEGSWVCKRSYYWEDGRLKGEIYNVNTPIEFCGGDRIRYIDLEVDVVRWPSGEIRIIDHEELFKRVEQGIIGKELAEKATEVARETAECLAKPTV